MAVNRAKQFEPAEQMDTAFNELSSAMADARRAIDRVEWLKDRLVESVVKLHREIDGFEVFTEAEAADRLQVKETHLAEQRRSLNLPHVAIGNKVRYTIDHLREITQILEVRRQRPAIKKAA